MTNPVHVRNALAALQPFSRGGVVPPRREAGRCGGDVSPDHGIMAPKRGTSGISPVRIIWKAAGIVLLVLSLAGAATLARCA